MSNARFSILQARAVEDARISDAQFRTLAALGRYGDKDGWCFPSLKTLGGLLHKSPQAVSKDIFSLVEFGYIEKHPRFNKDGSRQSNKYRLMFDLPPQPGEDPPSTSEVDTPSTSEVDTPSTSEVEVTSQLTTQVNDRERERVADAEIFNALADLPGGARTASTTRLVDAWKGKHPLEKILQAIEVSKAQDARSVRYVDKVLASWEEDGYPKPRRARPNSERSTTSGPKRHKLQDPVSQPVQISPERQEELRRFAEEKLGRQKYVEGEFAQYVNH